MMNVSLIARKLLAKSPTAIRKLGIKAFNNSPAILTGIGVVGVVVTTIFASQAAVKADAAVKNLKSDRQIKYENEEAESSEVTKKEIFKTAAPIYIPTAISGVLTIAAIIGSNRAGAHQKAVIASLYAASEATLQEYQKKVVEKIGEQGEREIKQSIVSDKLELARQKDIPIEGHGDFLCLDTLTGRLFRSSREEIKTAVNEVNRLIIGNIWVTMNEFYYELGLDPIASCIGDQLGWNVDKLLDVDITSSIENKTGEPYLVINYTASPIKCSNY